jgi:streptogramin lyase
VARDRLAALPSIDLAGSTDGDVAVESVVSTDEGVWAALPAEHALALLDGGTGAELRRVILDGYPYALAADGPDLWVTSFDDGQVMRVDRSTGEVRATIEGIDGPTGIAVGEGGVWVVANGSSRIVRIDPRTAEVLAQAVVPGKPHNLAVGAGGVWTANGQGGSVSRLDPATSELVGTIPVPGDAYDIEVVGGSVWATVGTRDGSGSDDTVVRIDPAVDSIAETLPFPGAWALISDGESLWVSGSDERGQLLAPIHW